MFFSRAGCQKLCHRLGTVKIAEKKKVSLTGLTSITDILSNYSAVSLTGAAVSVAAGAGVAGCWFSTAGVVCGITGAESGLLKLNEESRINPSKIAPNVQVLLSRKSVVF